MKAAYLAGGLVLSFVSQVHAQTAPETVAFLLTHPMHSHETRQVITTTEKIFKAHYPVSGSFQNGTYSHQVEQISACAYKISSGSTNEPEYISTVDFTNFDPDSFRIEKPDFLGLAYVHFPGVRYCQSDPTTRRPNPGSCTNHYKITQTSSNLSKFKKAAQHMLKFCTPRAF